MTDWSMSGAPEFKDIRMLIAGIDKGEIALPEFQRDFVWKPQQVSDLLVSVGRGWPAGTFLLLSGDKVSAFAAKEFNRAPELTGQPEVLVLDGQQRLTGLYHAFRDQSDDVYFCTMFELQDAGELDDDHIQSMKRNRFNKSYPDLKEQAKQGVIPIFRVVDDELFQEWINHLPDDRRAGMFRLRADLLPGLRSYQMPSVMLTGSVPLLAVAKIFETINRTGIRLATFDLMVARLYPHDFKLRDKWDEACATHPDTLDRYSDVTGIDVLKIISLWEHLRQKDEGVSPLVVKGVRESDVLQLDPQVVIERWDEAVAAFARAIAFVRDECGAVTSSLIPSHTMLIPLADALRSGDPSVTWARRLHRWFWATSVSQTYGQGANTQAVQDARALRAWQASDEAIPAVVRNGMPSEELMEETLRDSRRRNEMLVRAILCLTVARDGRDWVKDSRLSQLDEPMDVHHVFPRDFVEKRGWGDPNIVSNLTAVAQSTNKKIRSDSPSQVIERVDVKDSSIKSHLINLDAFRTDDWNGFLKARVKDLTDAFRELISPS